MSEDQTEGPQAGNATREHSSPTASHSKLIFVPRISETELVVAFEKRCEEAGVPLVYLRQELRDWPFSRWEGDPEERSLEVQGKSFRRAAWESKRTHRTMRNVFDHFRPQNAFGVTAAFLVELMETFPMGEHICFPSDELLGWFDPQINQRCAPCYSRTERGVHLCLRGIDLAIDSSFIAHAYEEVRNATS